MCSCVMLCNTAVCWSHGVTTCGCLIKNKRTFSHHIYCEKAKLISITTRYNIAISDFEIVLNLK